MLSTMMYVEFLKIYRLQGKRTQGVENAPDETDTLEKAARDVVEERNRKNVSINDWIRVDFGRTE